MNMEFRDEVILGLECCIKSDETGLCPAECQVRYKYGHECETGLKRDALELLKELEPRVLRYEQIKGIVEGVVWVELNGCEAVEPWIVHQGKIWRPDYNTGYEHWDVSKEDEYNRIVRCWTALPSYKQRKAVKWNA